MLISIDNKIDLKDEKDYNQQKWCEFTEKKQRVENKSWCENVLKQHNKIKNQQRKYNNNGQLAKSNETYQRLRYNQNIQFLSAKVQNQNKQIKSLTQQLTNCVQIQDHLKVSLQIQKDKSLKLKKFLQTTNKKFFETNKKLTIFQSTQNQQKQKRNSDQYKINKLRQILKKKQQQILKLQESLSSKHSEIKKIECYQNQLLSLRTNFIKSKSKQEQFKEQINMKSKKCQEYKKNIEQLKKNNLQKQTKISFLQDKLQKATSNFKIIQQCRQEGIQQNQKIQNQYNQIVDNLNRQILQLRKKNQLLATIKQDLNDTEAFLVDCKSEQLSLNKLITTQRQSNYSQINLIYIKEIQKILNIIKDKKTKSQILKQMVQLFRQIQKGWKNTLIGMIQKQPKFCLK